MLACRARSQSEVTNATIASDATSSTHAYRTVTMPGRWVQSSRTCPTLRSNGANGAPSVVCGHTARHQKGAAPASQIDATVVTAGAVRSQTSWPGPRRQTQSSSGRAGPSTLGGSGTCEEPAGRRRPGRRTSPA